MPAATITHVGLWDASTAGNFLMGGTTTNRTLGAGDTYTINQNDYDISFD
jgi:hypothetical protein